MEENLWFLLRSSDFANVKIGMMIYENNPDLKDKKLDGYIRLINEYYPEGKNWGELDLQGKKLTALPEFAELLPLKILCCNNNNLTELPYYSTLTRLWCYNNILTSLPKYTVLIQLDCHNNFLTSLPHYPDLTHLRCYNNQLTKLTEYPVIDYLDCENNQLTVLSEYPALTHLDCNNNNITSLPEYPFLKYLYCAKDLKQWYNLQYNTNFKL